MTKISTYAAHLQTLANFRVNREAASVLGNQLATGFKATDLSYFGNDARRLLDLRETIKRREGYIAAIDRVAPRLTAYDQTLGQIEKLGDDLSRSLGGLNNVADLAEFAPRLTQMIEDARFYLNQRFGDRYLYSGTRFATPPVGDIAALPDLPALAVSPPTNEVTSPTLPAYDAQAPGSSADAWRTEQFVADDGRTLSYGITSNATAFQDLVLALRHARSAVNDPTNLGIHLGNAKAFAAAANAAIRDLRGQLSGTQATIDRFRSAHADTNAFIRSQVDAIDKADINEVAAKLIRVKTQIEASYATTRQIASLSLVDFLR